MSMRKGIVCMCALFLIGLFFTFSKQQLLAIVQACASHACPPCTSDMPPLDGHGPAPDGSGRRRIIVFIDSSWGTPTNSNIYDETYNATQDWNNQVDATCSPPKQSKYYLQLNQLESGNADIIIKRVYSGSCGTNEREKHILGYRIPPDDISLRDEAASLPPAKLRRLIAHEIGHSLGLEYCVRMRL